MPQVQSIEKELFGNLKIHGPTEDLARTLQDRGAFARFN